ncbi:uncharacterized protein LOC125340677 isoform X2 [Perognathus longimembris pacificus]|uniref:uncharacterized protein LOC125340677 isoform X2 n=1 Tax=Perognathus longimembris pacificus TaxID=214514 RepID=UPI002018A90D|nr:uncharacterized protein LOC125340677 isoform X2 [Perognathus longimembris pacificus]
MVGLPPSLGAALASPPLPTLFGFSRLVSRPSHLVPTRKEKGSSLRLFTRPPPPPPPRHLVYSVPKFSCAWTPFSGLGRGGLRQGHGRPGPSQKRRARLVSLGRVFARPGGAVRNKLFWPVSVKSLEMDGSSKAPSVLLRKCSSGGAKQARAEAEIASREIREYGLKRIDSP